MSKKPVRRLPAPEARLVAANRRRARAAMSARDEIDERLAHFTDERICELYRVVEALTEPDAYGGGVSGPAQRGGVADRVGALVAAHAGGRIDELGGLTDDSWRRDPDSTLVRITAAMDRVHQARRLLRLASQDMDRVLSRHELHDESRGSTLSECRVCRATISGDVGDWSHAGLCVDCWGEYQSLPLPRPPVHEFVETGGRCDHCDHLSSGAAGDRLRLAGETGERYCPASYQRWLRAGRPEAGLSGYMAEEDETAGRVGNA